MTTKAAAHARLLEWARRSARLVTHLKAPAPLPYDPATGRRAPGRPSRSTKAGGRVNTLIQASVREPRKERFGKLA